MPHYDGVDLGGLQNLKCFGLSGVFLKLHQKLFKKTQSDVFYEVAALQVKLVMIKINNFLLVG